MIPYETQIAANPLARRMRRRRPGGIAAAPAGGGFAAAPSMGGGPRSPMPRPPDTDYYPWHTTQDFREKEAAGAAGDARVRSFGLEAGPDRRVATTAALESRRLAFGGPEGVADRPQELARPAPAPVPPGSVPPAGAVSNVMPLRRKAMMPKALYRRRRLAY